MYCHNRRCEALFKATSRESLPQQSPPRSICLNTPIFWSIFRGKERNTSVNIPLPAGTASEGLITRRPVSPAPPPTAVFPSNASQIRKNRSKRNENTSATKQALFGWFVKADSGVGSQIKYHNYWKCSHNFFSKTLFPTNVFADWYNHWPLFLLASILIK